MSVAACGLSLGVLSGGYPPSSLQQLPLLKSMCPWARGLQREGSGVKLHGLTVLQHVGSCWTTERAHVLCTARQILTTGPPGTPLGSPLEGGPWGLGGGASVAPRKGLGQKETTGFAVRGLGSCPLCSQGHTMLSLFPHLKSEVTTHTSGSSRGMKSTQAVSLRAGPPDLSNQITRSHPREPQLPRARPHTQEQGDSAGVKSSHSECLPQNEHGALLPTSMGDVTG